MGRIWTRPSHWGPQRPHKLDKTNKMLFTLLNHLILAIQDSIIQFLSFVECSITKPTWHLYRPTSGPPRCCDDRNRDRMASKKRKIRKAFIVFLCSFKKASCLLGWKIACCKAACNVYQNNVGYLNLNTALYFIIQFNLGCVALHLLF